MEILSGDLLTVAAAVKRQHKEIDGVKVTLVFGSFVRLCLDELI